MKKKPGTMKDAKFQLRLKGITLRKWKRYSEKNNQCLSKLIERAMEKIINEGEE